jgi:hypothetical protein
MVEEKEKEKESNKSIKKNMESEGFASYFL